MRLTRLLSQLPAFWLAALPGRSALAAQQPTPPSSSSPVLAPYRAPAIALVQPAAGGTLPHDRPVLVFRFAAGEPNDPLDTRSFAVAVDGEDRTALFQATSSEAWGPLASPSGSAVTPGAHQITARICSSRGPCGETSVLVTVVPAAAASDAARKEDKRGKDRVIQAVLSVLKQLLAP